MVEITGVVKRSPAWKAEVKSLDKLVSINGNEVEDVLDYMFYSAEDKVKLEILRGEETLYFDILKSEYDDLGLEFKSFLMDDKKTCHNKCVFCFIDQMPPNMRETLYFKDDDARLSFLQGNYVTLTNLKQKDIDRIIKMRLNVNVSVHTTNPELRCKMMHNRFAGDTLKYLKQMTDSGLQLNCQLVLCPNLNDGEELERTLHDLGELMPNISSVAGVPVGLSKFRDGLYPLESFTKESAGRVIDTMKKYQDEFLERYGTRMVFPSDEFFLIAEREIPSAEYYEDYPQFENGVGMLRSLMDEFQDALSLADDLIEPRKVSIATGYAPYTIVQSLVNKATQRWNTLECNVYPILNEFFGEKITVTGLLTAQDLVKQLKGKPLGDELLLSKSMFKSDEDIFLDDVTLEQLEETLNVKVRKVDNDGFALLDAILGVEI
jgi:putative radical SAM enzyme (TIGR03279 family)